MMATKGFGELGRLPVADAQRNLTDRALRVGLEELCCTFHPQSLHTLAKRLARMVGEAPLQLSARRRDLARDVIDPHGARQAGLHQHVGLSEKLLSTGEGGGAMHPGVYAPNRVSGCALRSALDEPWSTLVGVLTYTGMRARASGPCSRG
jgi:hypothetical protein